MSDFGVSGIQLFFISPSGERLGILSDENNSGKLLRFRVTTVKQGGVDKFNFNIARDNPLPLSRNTEVFIYVDGVLWFTGFINDIPEPDQDSPVLTIGGSGFYKRLSKKIINRSYSNQTLSYIANDILSNELTFDVGVNYDVSKITLPSLINISMEFKDQTLLDAVSSIMSVANYDYENEKYRFEVDVEKDLFIGQYGETLKRGLFEGFQYQIPDVSIDNTRIKNKLLTFRTSLTDDSVVEYVSTVEDLEAQGRDGIFESKLVVPHYINAATLGNIANFILSRYKNPQKKIELDNLLVTSPIDFDLYAISNRREKYWEVINDCDDINIWDTTNLSTASAILSNEHILTGRQSIKVSCNNSESEYLEYTLPAVIPLPQYVRMYVYFDTTPLQLSVEFFDRNGNSTTITLGTSPGEFHVDESVGNSGQMAGDSGGVGLTFIVDVANEVVVDQWLVLKEEVGDETQLATMVVDSTSGSGDTFVVDYDENTSGSLAVRKATQAALLEIAKVRVTVETNTAGSFYLDRFDTYADIYKRSDLLLESVDYSLSKTRKIAKASFGEREDNIVDEVEKQVKDGDIALSIFTKQ